MKQRSKVYRTSYILRFIVFILFHVFAWFYNIRKVVPKEVQKLKPPYLVLGNHVGFFDPFITGTFLPAYTHFVASDAAFRGPFMGFFLTRLGAIPKKKNIRDSKVIRDIISVIRQGNNVGVFPEAVRNWCGTSFPIDKSIAKLIRLLKVPVVVPIMKGMNLFNPRWAREVRKGKVVIDYSLLFTAKQVMELSEDEIIASVLKEISHDEVDYQREAMIKIRSNKRAEYISHALYICPECRSIDSFRCAGNNFHCVDCGYNIHINVFGFFERQGEGELYFDNIRDWYYWEEKYLIDLVKSKLYGDDDELIFKDSNSTIYCAGDGDKFECKGQADISLYKDRIVISYHTFAEEVFNFDDLQTINPQVYERLEIYYNGQAYRIIGSRPGVSALKWEVAANSIWRQLGQEPKLSPYINSKD